MAKTRFTLIGIALTLFFFASAVVNFVKVVAVSAPPGTSLITMVVGYPNVWSLLLFGAIHLLTVLIGERPGTRATQVGAMILLGLFSKVLAPPNTVNGDMVVVVALFLAAKYGFYERRARLKLLISIAVLILTTLASWIVHGSDSEMITNVILTFFILVITTVVYWLTFEDDIRRLNIQRRRLRQRLEEERAFVEYGKQAAALVHDLKGDLSMVKLGAQMLHSRVPENGRSWLEAVDTGVKRLEEHIGLILYATGRREDVRVEDISLLRLIDASVYMFQVDREVKRSVRFVVDQNGDCIVRAHRYLLLQIVENTVKNSVEAMRDQENATVTITLRGSVLSIANNGPAVEQCRSVPAGSNCLKHVDFRIGESSKETGSGVGMPTIIAACERLGVSVALYSEEGNVRTVVDMSAIAISGTGENADLVRPRTASEPATAAASATTKATAAALLPEAGE